MNLHWIIFLWEKNTFFPKWIHKFFKKMFHNFINSFFYQQYVKKRTLSLNSNRRGVVKILWKDVDKMDNLNLHQKQKVIFPQINIPNSNRLLN